MRLSVKSLIVATLAAACALAQTPAALAQVPSAKTSAATAPKAPPDTRVTIALAAYRAGDFASAIRIFRAALDRDTLTEAEEHALRLGLARALRKSGQLDEAEAEAATVYAKADHDARSRGLAATILGRVAHLRGELEQARAFFEEAAGDLADEPADRLVATLFLAGLATDDRDFGTAYEAYSAALADARAIGHAEHEATALMGLALGLARVSELTTSAWLAQQAAPLYHKVGRSMDVARVSAHLAMVALLRGDLDAVDPLLDEAEPALRQSVTGLREVRLIRATRLLAAGELDRAEAELERVLLDASKVPIVQLDVEATLIAARVALERKRFTEAERLLSSIEGPAGPGREGHKERVRGELEVLRGRDEQAERALRRFVDLHEAQRSGQQKEQLTHFYDRDRVRVYESYLRLLGGRRDGTEAARILRLVKARSVVNELGRSSAASGVENGARRVPSAAEHAVRHTALSRPGVGEGDAPEQSCVPDQGGAPEQDGAPKPWDASQSWTGTAIIDYYLLDDQILSVYSHRGTHRLVIAPYGRAEIERRVDAAVSAMSHPERPWRGPLGALAEVLLEPLASALDAPDAPEVLVLVPHGALHRVSFAALPWRGGVLLDRFATTVVPNRALARAATSPLNLSGADALVLGDPDGTLPAARAEARRLAERLPGSRLLIGTSATEAAVRAQTAELLHIAAHGIRASGGTRTLLQLAPGAGFDGRLSAVDIAALPKTARLVVLSACESAVGALGLADEMPDLLAHAFLRAGTETVIASRWRVADSSTRFLMERFYDELPRVGRARALALAQRAVREVRPDAEGKIDGQSIITRRSGCRALVECPPAVDAPWSHPFHWAAFTALGTP